MLRWIVAVETDYCGNKSNTICGLRIAPIEIMLGELADHPVSTEQQSQRLNDRSLTAVVGANEYGVRRETDCTFTDSAKILDF